MSTAREPHTSYDIHWERQPQQISTTQGTPSACLYKSPAGTDLFTVVTHGVLPSEGIFTLIAHAPRIRDQAAAADRQLEELRRQLVALSRQVDAIGAGVEQIQQDEASPGGGPGVRDLPELTAAAAAHVASLIAGLGPDPDEDFHP